MKQIKTIEELKELASRYKGLNCFIRLNFGARSSKHISYDGDTFYVFNEIDESEDELTEDQLMDENYTLIGEAMRKGALWNWDQ